MPHEGIACLNLNNEKHASARLLRYSLKNKIDKYCCYQFRYMSYHYAALVYIKTFLKSHYNASTLYFNKLYKFWWVFLLLNKKYLPPFLLCQDCPARHDLHCTPIKVFITSNISVVSYWKKQNSFLFLNKYKKKYADAFNNSDNNY